MTEALRALREKYAEMRAMRIDHAEGREHEHPLARMRALAERFPGALREIDELPLELIEARIAELDAALAGQAPAPAWAGYLALYHAWMRAALAMRRAAGKERDRAQALAWARGHVGDPPSAELLEEVDTLLRPPTGRLSRWVIERIARSAGRDPREIEEEAFPPSPRRRARIA